MIRLAAHILLLTFAGSIAAPCFAADKIDDNDDRLVTISFTKANGSDAISLQGAKSTVIARSLTLSDGAKTMKITAYAEGIEMRFGSHVIRATELQLCTMPLIEALDLLEIRINSKP